MIIAIPTKEQRICEHFGQSKQFALVTTEQSQPSVMAVEYVDAPDHRDGEFPHWLKDKQTDLVIAGKIGKKARDLLMKYQIKVITGVKEGSPESIARAFFSSSLVTQDDFCDCKNHKQPCNHH